MATKQQYRGPKCYNCHKFGHIQKHCSERNKTRIKDKKLDFKPKRVGLISQHVLGSSEQVQQWVIDSGATCHICNKQELFEEFHVLPKPQEITLGDDRTVQAIGTGIVELKLKLPGGESQIGRLSDVLYVPDLAYNLLSISKVTEQGKEVVFDETQVKFEMKKESL